MKVALVERFIKLTIQRQLVILFLFSFLIRLVFSVIFVQTRGIYLEADGAEYVRFAKCILDQGWMVKDTGPLFGSMIGPGYPMLVALNLLISGFDNFWFLILFQSIIGAMSVIVIYELAFLLSDSRTVALISGLWLALYIQYIWYTPWVLKETLVFFLFPFSVLLLIRIRKSLKPLSWDNIIFILTYSYLIHTDERYIAFLPLFAGYLLISTDHFKKRVLTTAIMLGGVLLCMIPWLYRNYIVYQRPVVISVRTTVITDKLLGYEPLWDRGVRWNQGINNYRTRPDSEKSNSIYKAVVDSLIAGHKVLRTEDQIFGINAIKKANAEGLYLMLSHRFKGSFPILFHIGGHLSSGEVFTAMDTDMSRHGNPP